jgi:hypothetical protein
MDDERTPGAGAPEESTRANATAAPAAAPVRKKRSRLWLKLLGILVVLPVLLIAAWFAITLNWVYSSGDRAGYVQKFSEKGWVCKTWEGDLAMSSIPGSMPERFTFTVRDDSVAHEITRLMASRVSIHYEQHRGVPSSCFGDTEYYVTAVKPVAGP